MKSITPKFKINDNKIDKTISYLAEEWYTFEGKTNEI